MSARTAALLMAAACFLAGAVFGADLLPELRGLGGQIAARRAHAVSLRPLIEQARGHQVSYDDARPGDTVDWCIDHPSKDFSYVAGRQSQPVLWVDDAAAPVTPGSKSACDRMLARVVSREPQGLKLEFLGQP